MTEHLGRMWYHLLQQGDELKDPVFIQHVCIVETSLGVQTVIRDILSTTVIMVDIRLNFLEQMVQAKKII
jgi:hypothetical protein